MTEDAVYFDFHTHILPGADHGSRGAEDTAAEMRELYELGAGIAVATPHFYPARTNIEKFRAVRNAALVRFEKIRQPFWCPTCVGAEVAVCQSLERMPELDELCIDGTSVILLEMPFARWMDSILDTVAAIRDAGFTPVFAHLDRYEPEAAEALFALGMKGQLNLSALGTRNPWKRKRLLGWIDGRSIVAVGSDIHTSSVRDDRAETERGISTLGEERLEYLRHSTADLLRGAKIYDFRPKKSDG